jgi:hypothetical protein
MLVDSLAEFDRTLTRVGQDLDFEVGFPTVVIVGEQQVAAVPGVEDLAKREAETGDGDGEARRQPHGSPQRTPVENLTQLQTVEHAAHLPDRLAQHGGGEGGAGVGLLGQLHRRDQPFVQLGESPFEHQGQRSMSQTTDDPQKDVPEKRGERGRRRQNHQHPPQPLRHLEQVIET